MDICRTASLTIKTCGRERTKDKHRNWCYNHPMSVLMITACKSNHDLISIYQALSFVFDFPQLYLCQMMVGTFHMLTLSVRLSLGIVESYCYGESVLGLCTHNGHSSSGHLMEGRFISQNSVLMSVRQWHCARKHHYCSGILTVQFIHHPFKAQLYFFFLYWIFFCIYAPLCWLAWWA